MQHQSIKSWAVDDRPREKYLNKGKRALSTAELLSIIIGSGSKASSALDIAREILVDNNHDLDKIANLDVSGFIRYRGIGKVKAIHLSAVFELGRRREKPFKPQVKISSSSNAYEHMGYLLQDLTHEEFWILILNRANRVIQSKCISKGGVSGTVVDVKIILKSLVEQLASSVILLHNHPSGNIEPSEADIKITKKVKMAAESMDIALLDHLIIGGKQYFSFADEGLL